MKQFLLLLFFFFLFFIVQCDERVLAYAIPHSHCDPGWKVPVQTYFAQNVSKIISNVILSLKENQERRFIWAEVVYFQMWWEKSSSEQKDLVRELVTKGQLNFVAGGWVMNDEAVTNYKDTIVQMTTGNLYLGSILGVKPSIGWQIDPFGASRSQPSLISKMGYKYHIINRVDDRLKFDFSSSHIPNTDILKIDKLLQFYWSPYTSQPDESIFSEILYRHYSAPLGFDFENNNQTSNPEITADNVKERSHVLANIILERSKNYRTNLIMVPFGDDFRYQDADKEFKSIDQLITEIHTNPDDYGIDIKYATLEEYYEDLMKSSKNNVDFPKKTDGKDYLPYARCSGWYQKKYDLCIAYWVGFYSSFPVFIKKLAREASRSLARMEVWDTLVPSYDSNNIDEDSDVLDDFRRTIGLMQHHDTITGTFTPNTRTDSIDKILKSWDEGNKYLSRKLSRHLSKTKEGQEYVSNNLVLPRTELSEEKILFDDSHQVIALTVWNHLGWRNQEVVNASLFVSPHTPLTSTSLNQGNGQMVAHDVIDRGVTTKGLRKYDIYFLPDVPPLAFTTYYLTNSTGLKPILVPQNCLEDQPMELSNEYYTLNFTNGEITNLLANGEKYDFSSTFWEYKGLGDDAYRFRPVNDPVEMAWEKDNSACKFTIGNFVKEMRKEQEVTGRPGIVSQVMRVFGEGPGQDQIQTEVEVYLPQTSEFETSEVVVRYESTNIENYRMLFHDTNGYGLIERPPFNASYYNDTSKYSQYAGNYYPMTSVSGISSLDNHQLVLFTQSPLGVSSPKSGVLETMITRNTRDEDPDSINAFMYSPVKIPFRIMVHCSKNKNNDGIIEPLRVQRTSKLFENTMLMTFLPLQKTSTSVQWDKDLRLENSFLSYEVNENVHILTVRKNDDDVLLRLENLDDEKTQQVSLEWTNRKMKDVVSTTLSFMEVKGKRQDGDTISTSLDPLGFESVMFQWGVGSDHHHHEDNKTKKNQHVVIIVVSSVCGGLLLCCLCLCCLGMCITCSAVISFTAVSLGIYQSKKRKQYWGRINSEGKRLL